MAEGYHKPFSPTKEPFSFKAYKDKRLAELLTELFNAKCAYCESSMKAVQPQDIEHYRPKQAVLIDGKLDKPGYYWLASDWPNLLSSCIFCNRPNRHKIGSKRAAKALGKGNDFPLEVEKDRVRDHALDISGEKPLILDPCGTVDPALHLKFSCDGWIEPTTDHAGVASKQGTSTINILALQRPGLVKERFDRATLILGELVIYDVHEADVARGQGSRLSLALSLVRIDRYLKPDQPYLGMARQLIEQRKPGLIQMLPIVLNSDAPEIVDAKRMLTVPARQC